MTTATRPRPPTRKPPAKPQPAGAVKFSKPSNEAGHRVVLYGPGGIGKTTLAACLPGKTVFFDLDESLGRLGLDVQIVNVQSWDEIRDALAADGWDGVDNIIVDTGTKAEEMATAFTLASVKHEKGHTCKSVEDYGYGKGYGHVFETFMQILGDLDRHARAGRNVCLICHDCTNTVPNPAGDDWIRYEPRLQSPNSGKASIRLRVREWADHVLFVGYDVAVDKGGKGQGAGTRTLYRAELPHCMAKSRTGCEQIPMDGPEEGSSVWEQIIV